MPRFTEFAKECLIKAGWHEGREVPTEEFEEANRKKGYYVGPMAIPFFEEFGGLRLTYPHRRRPEDEDRCHFDATIATEASAYILDYEFTIGKRLTMIGQSSNGWAVLCMDEDGRVFEGSECYLGKLGDSGEEAVNCLCEGRDAAPIEVQEVIVPQPEKEPELSTVARAALDEGGWKEQKSGERDYRTKPTVFLAKYSGVVLRYPNKNGGKDVCRIGPYYPPQQFIREVGGMEPIGKLEASGMLLLMDYRGCVFANAEEILYYRWFLGSSGNDAINNLVAGKEWMRV